MRWAHGWIWPNKISQNHPWVLTAIEDKEDKVKFLNSVYDFDMSCIKRQAMMKRLVDIVDQNQTVTNCRLLERMDISEMTDRDGVDKSATGYHRVSEFQYYGVLQQQWYSADCIAWLAWHFFYIFVWIFPWQPFFSQNNLSFFKLHP